MASTFTISWGDSCHCVTLPVSQGRATLRTLRGCLVGDGAGMDGWVREEGRMQGWMKEGMDGQMDGGTNQPMDINLTVPLF